VEEEKIRTTPSQNKREWEGRRHTLYREEKGMGDGARH